MFYFLVTASVKHHVYSGIGVYKVYEFDYVMMVNGVIN
jgi:hypothetical protein